MPRTDPVPASGEQALGLRVRLWRLLLPRARGAALPHGLLRRLRGASVAQWFIPRAYHLRCPLAPLHLLVPHLFMKYSTSCFLHGLLRLVNLSGLGAVYVHGGRRWLVRALR
jgi:hypothetical protein